MPSHEALPLGTTDDFFAGADAFPAFGRRWQGSRCRSPRYFSWRACLKFPQPVHWIDKLGSGTKSTQAGAWHLPSLKASSAGDGQLWRLSVWAGQSNKITSGWSNTVWVSEPKRAPFARQWKFPQAHSSSRNLTNSLNMRNTTKSPMRPLRRIRQVIVGLYFWNNFQ